MTEGIDWCQTSIETPLDVVRNGGCQLEPLHAEDRGVGFTKDLVWVRLRLRNSAPEALERWLQVGNPRLTEISVYQPDGRGGWAINKTGYGVPLAERSLTSRFDEVTPIRIAPGDSVEVWVRIQSVAIIHLDVVLWESHAYRDFIQSAQAWLILATGGLLLGLILSLMMFVMTAKPQFGFFALALIGEFILSIIRNGIILRLIWPETLPVPIELTSIGGFFMLLGLGGYVYTTIPSIKSMREELFAMQGLILATAVFQLFSIFVDYQLGVMIWASIAPPLIALFAWVSFRAWREGDSFARWVFMAFVVLSVALALRTPGLYSHFPENWVDIVLAPISMLGVVSLVLVGLFEQMRALERQLMSANLATNAQIDFLSRMSHELRTPLDSVLGNAQLLMRGSDRLQKAPELIGIVNNGRHLLRLIDEILDYARGTAGALKLRSEPVLLEAYLHEIESTAQILAARNGNTFKLVDRGSTSNLREWVLEFDAGRLRQVLDNLIVNAARHTRGGTITLEYGLSTTRDGHRQLSFAVSDTGEGIPAADRERIFLPFERVGRAEQYGGKGAGMGLAIARQLVELMGGRLTVESTPGSGSTFRFFISVALSDASEIIETDTAPSPLEARGYAGRPRIALVIDDDPGGRSIFSGLLTRAGFEVREADTGNAGVAIARQCEVLDVVVTGQFMPDGDGWLVLETLSRLRPEVPVVMVSAAPGSAPERFPTELQFAHEFLKPVDHRSFLTVIGQLLGLRWTLSPPVARGLDTPADLRPNREELLALREMVELGEITAIREWARSLRLRTPQFSGFADRVEAAVADLDLDLLETLAREPAPV